MRKNAFTLVELLAVIVILAIIALIATPIVIHIINDTKTSSGEEAVKLYIDSVKKAISRKQLEDTSFNPSICTIKDNGNLLCNDIKVTIDMKGIKPTKGIIEIKDNQVTYKNLLLNGTYYNRLVTPVQDNNNNGKPDIGDKYTYKVNDTDTFNFYVLSFNEADDTVNLIMDRNICNDGKVNYTNINNYCNYQWYSSERNNTYGPTTIMQELYEGTKDWSNVPDMIMDYVDEANIADIDQGYTSIITKNGVTTITGKPTTKVTTIGTSLQPLKARLAKHSEIKTGICKNSTCPAWLIENMTYYNTSDDKYSINNNNESYQRHIYGYWLLSSVSFSNSKANILIYSGGVVNDNSIYGAAGARPVITVPKGYLEN